MGQKNERCGSDSAQKLLTVADVAKELSVSTDTIRRLIARRILPAARVNGTRVVRIRHCDVERLLVKLK